MQGFDLDTFGCLGVFQLRKVLTGMRVAIRLYDGVKLVCVLARFSKNTRQPMK